MRELLKNIVEIERIIEEIKEEKPNYKTFYIGYLTGLREAKSLIVKKIFKNI